MKKFYDFYPTIYHLRKVLMPEHRQLDLRWVYLTIHHIVKYRESFLRSCNLQKFQPGNWTLTRNLHELIKTGWKFLMNLAPKLQEKDLEDGYICHFRDHSYSGGSASSFGQVTYKGDRQSKIMEASTDGSSDKSLVNLVLSIISLKDW